MKYLFDTHAWVWWNNRPEKLPARVQALLAAGPLADFALSDLSILEAARAIGRKDFQVNVPPEVWFDRALAGLRVLPLTARACLKARDFAWKHRDPGDRLICGVAEAHGLALLTCDDAITRWGGVPVIW